MTPPDANEKLTRRILDGLGVRPVGHQAANDEETAPPAPEQQANRLPPWWEAKKPVPAAPETPAEASAPPIPPKPAQAPRDWLDDIFDSDATPAPEPTTAPEPSPEPDKDPPDKATGEDGEQSATKPNVFQPQPDYWPHPHTPEFITDLATKPAISKGTRRLLYNATAAGTGWWLGLYQEFADAIADCGQQSIGGALVLAAVSTALIAHLWDRRTRHWWPGIAWAARIPLATALLAVALWAPAAS